MEITRRQFGKTAVAVVATPSALSMMAMKGCSPSQVENEINTVLSEATNILAVAEPGAEFIAPLQAAIAALKTAEASWQGGGAVADVEAALQTIEDVTAVIPLTAAYSPLIDILVAGIDAVLAALPAPAAAAATPHALMAHATVQNPHKGRVTVKSAAESKTVWNNIVAANPHLAAAKL